MEARLYAENPGNGFLPSTGPLDHFRLPTDDARIDTGVEAGSEVTAFYDPMIAKIIVHADTREAAAAKLAEACAKVEVWPVKTNAGFLARAAAHPDFVAGYVDTGFIEARLDTLAGAPAPSEDARTVAALALVESDDRDPAATPWAALGGATGFRLNADPRAEVRLETAGAVVTTPLVKDDLDAGDVLRVDDGVVVFKHGEAYAFRWPQAQAGDHDAAADGVLTSPMPGRIALVGAEAGSKVAKGQAIVTLEAMKMEHTLTAPFDGVLAELNVKAGDQVAEGVTLACIEADG